MSGHPALLRPAERLARSAPSEISDARRSVDDVLATAAELARLLPHPAAVEEPDPVWQLARRLASLRVPSAAGRHMAAVGAADAAFRSALVGSLEAIRMCRQTLHVSGACWFATGDEADGCGEVLRAAHALS